MSVTIETTARLAIAERLLDVGVTQHLLAKVSTGKDEGTIVGTACRYGEPVDRGFGMSLELVAGCFAAAVRDPARVLVLWQHDDDEPIGRMRDLADSAETLDYEGWITSSADVPNGRRALSLLRDQVIDQVSVGFRIQKYERVVDEEADTVIYRILRAHLMELSIVTFGAFGAGATVEQVFSQGEPAAAPALRAADEDLSRLRARVARWGR